MSGFELIVILIIVANVVAAILKKRKQPKDQVPNSPQRHQGEFEEDQEEGPAYSDFGGYEKRQIPARTARMEEIEEIEEEGPSLEVRAGVEGVAETAIPAAPPRKRSAALQVIDFSHRTPRILGLQSKSDLRRAFLLSEVLGSPRSLSQD